MHHLLSGVRQWYHAHRTAQTLEAMSDSELKDIGVQRCAIPGIARRTRAEWLAANVPGSPPGHARHDR